MSPLLTILPDRLSGDPYLGGDVLPDAIAEVRLNRFPPEVVLVDGRIGFVHGAQREDLTRFARLHGVPFDQREDVWASITEPFLDTELDAADQERTLARLERVGVSRDEVAAVRGFLRAPMLALTARTWEWVHYGLYDVLLAAPPVCLSVGWWTGSPWLPERAGAHELRRWAERLANRPPPAPFVPCPPSDAEVREQLRGRFVTASWSAERTPERSAADNAWVGALRDELLAAWSAPHRRYHTPRHLLAVLAGARGGSPEPAFVLAAWFHDAVYEPTRADNEEQSAQWLERVAPELRVRTSVTQAHVELALAMIRSTARPLDPVPPGAAGEAIAHFLDADFGVFASLPDDYAAYVAGVREEFSFVPDELFQQGRLGFLLRLREAVSRRGFFFREATPLAEHLARGNLEREIAGLG
jgi:predicted metal-dependent HD superfamily phosphohydrolase